MKKSLQILSLLLLTSIFPVNADSLSLEFLSAPLVAITSEDLPRIISKIEDSARLNGITINIKNCEKSFALSGGKNKSYIAICTLEPERFPIMICSDEMSGSFALSVTFAKTPESMARFLVKHCYGG